jgi:acyl carrier protein
MLSRDDIRNTVMEIVADHFEQEEEFLTEEHRIVADLGADSLDVIELTMELEDTFETSISDAEMDGCATIGQIVDFLASKEDVLRSPYNN